MTSRLIARAPLASLARRNERERVVDRAVGDQRRQHLRLGAGRGRPRAPRPQRSARAMRWRQVWLSAPFVFGCAFRSVFPRADVQRIVVVDSWLSSVAVGRMVAMIAEVSFAAQCALFLRYRAEAATIARRRRHLARHRAAHRDGRDVLLVFGDHDQLHRQHDGGIDLDAVAALLIVGHGARRARGWQGGLRAFLVRRSGSSPRIWCS